jgi:hypothetical protein
LSKELLGTHSPGRHALLKKDDKDMSSSSAAVLEDSLHITLLLLVRTSLSKCCANEKSIIVCAHLSTKLISHKFMQPPILKIIEHFIQHLRTVACQIRGTGKKKIFSNFSREGQCKKLKTMLKTPSQIIAAVDKRRPCM